MRCALLMCTLAALLDRARLISVRNDGRIQRSGLSNATSDDKPYRNRYSPQRRNYPYPYRPGPYPYNNPNLYLPNTVSDAIASIAEHDDLECVPKLICEMTTGGRASNLQNWSFLPSFINQGTLLALLDTLDATRVSPYVKFVKAAAVGYMSRSTYSNACAQRYPRCPQDADKLVDYLNNHKGGLFRYFRGLRGGNYPDQNAPPYGNVHPGAGYPPPFDLPGQGFPNPAANRFPPPPLLPPIAPPILQQIPYPGPVPQHFPYAPYGGVPSFPHHPYPPAFATSARPPILQYVPVRFPAINPGQQQQYPQQIQNPFDRYYPQRPTKQASQEAAPSSPIRFERSRSPTPEPPAKKVADFASRIRSSPYLQGDVDLRPLSEQEKRPRWESNLRPSHYAEDGSIHSDTMDVDAGPHEDRFAWRAREVSLDTNSIADSTRALAEAQRRIINTASSSRGRAFYFPSSSRNQITFPNPPIRLKLREEDLRVYNWYSDRTGTGDLRLDPDESPRKILKKK